ncbi:MAG: DEAD/DEAH box helicase [Coriobacteriales bacterium]|jgi:superfamily II RNA helicase
MTDELGSDKDTKQDQTANEYADQDVADEDASSFGSLGRLADDFWDRGDATDDEILEAFIEWCLERGIELWPHQEDATMDLMVGDHVILGTPTGSGKSLVALALHFKALCRDERSIYTAPIKALVSEKFFSLVEYFGRERVGMITGDTSINSDAPIICCTEEILANEALREGEDADVASVAMDEFHYFGESDRGWAWQVPLLILKKTQFLLMSATLGDMTAISEMLSRQTGRDVDIVDNAERPVPLSYEYVKTAVEATVELALREGDAPLYLVHFSQAAAVTTAQHLASYGVTDKEQRKKIKEAVKGTKFSTPFGKTLRHLLECGVGVHHAGMLPRYRLLVEKLAQQGLLPVICGTDTLGVGINVPIHTVVLTALAKFDGKRMRRLRAREFHQIAGRAGRAGFDTAGLVLCEAPEFEIENAHAMTKAAGDPKKLKKIKKKKPEKGEVTWNEGHFKHLIESVPEALTPRLSITHSMVLSEVSRGGDAHARLFELIDSSMQPAPEKAELKQRCNEIFRTLIDAGVAVKTEGPDGTPSYETTVELPDNFALDQPLSPFLLAALELLDPESETYALDVISMAESTLENPAQVLKAQRKQARDKAMAEMKADGIDYDERIERIQEVDYPKPLEDLLVPAFESYCQEVPWANDFYLRPKSVVRDMVESAANFNGYVQSYGIARSEGTLLRYLSDAYRVLSRTVPLEKRNDQLEDIVSWLGMVVRSIDSSLLDEWESAGEEAEAAPPEIVNAVVKDVRAVTVLVRNALFTRVRWAAFDDDKSLGEADADWGFPQRRWKQELDNFYEAHEAIILDADARSWAYLTIDDSDEKDDHVWHVHQIFKDSDDDRDFGIKADVDLDATQETGEVVFKNYRAGFIEDLLEE